MKSDEDDNYKPFYVSRRIKKKKRGFRLKSRNDLENSEDLEESEISDGELESFFRAKPKKNKKTNALKRTAIKKKYLFFNHEYGSLKKKTNILRPINKESELVFLLKWRHGTRLSPPCTDEKFMKYFLFVCFFLFFF